METRPLGNTDMHITPIGFGSFAIGGANWQYGWGHQDDGEAIRAMEHAVDLGACPSLRRLGVDAIDLYQMHWPDPEADIEEGWFAMAHLQAQGQVRYIGVSNLNVTQMRQLQLIAPISTLQPPYSPLNHDIEHEILPFCGANTIGVIVYAPMAAGPAHGNHDARARRQLPS